MQEIATRRQFVDAIEDPVRTVITASGWKFNCSRAGEHELYNLNDDPLETANLAGASESRPVVKELGEALRRIAGHPKTPAAAAVVCLRNRRRTNCRRSLEFSRDELLLMIDLRGDAKGGTSWTDAVRSLYISSFAASITARS